MEPFRILVVAAEEHIGEPLQRELSNRGDGRETEVRVVVPALADSAFEQAAGAVDEGLERAQKQLDESLAEVRESNATRGEGLVGDADPLLAIDDALYDFPADEILIVTHPQDRARSMEGDLFERAAQRFHQPLRHFVVENGSIKAAGESGAGLPESARREVEAEPRNLPRFTLRDLAGIGVAVVGTLILIVIASSNPDETGSGFDFDALHTIIAGLFALINIAHVVGLVLFESVGYRGLPARFFAYLSLYGTPLAVAVSLLLLLV